MGAKLIDQLPRISIVTPSYNQAAFIAETIESVLSQSGDFEIEYLVMDGGSTDRSVEVIRRYADRVALDWPATCARVSMKWVTQRDRGQSDAINQGLRQATGDIVGYINSDDLYYRGAFDRVVTTFAARPEADFVYGNGDLIDKDGRPLREWASRPFNCSVLASYDFLRNGFRNYIMQPATFWRRSVLDKIGYFDETFHYALDLEYWIRAGRAGLNLHHIPHKLAKFRTWPGTKTLSSRTVFWEDHLELYRRYRGGGLAIFFAYYYYNLARQFELDLARTAEEASGILRRWEGLPAGERQLIAQQAARGFGLACFLLASDLRSQRRFEEGASAFRSGLANRPLIILHPFALAYLLNRISGPVLSPILHKITRFAIRVCLQMRYNWLWVGRNMIAEDLSTWRRVLSSG